MSEPARRGWRWAGLALLCLISYLALSPAPPKSLDTGWDKANHLLAFAALAFCGFWSLQTPKQRLLGLPLGLLAYGGAIELIQFFVPGRSCEWADLGADSIGIALGLLLAGLAWRWLRRSS
ncbi:VanZ family protein [Paucibacter oligotrophus]|uniref:VanZ family protein n=1 Tax=Roseateles oligotrophus TaxID=1769250 RepID=A0A840L2N5_9BURK|nr:VanZ family protein [Roseateles oligotrophus]MBB4842186.1 VanZ family protein [Roseateles oligotrophus]